MKKIYFLGLFAILAGLLLIIPMRVFAQDQTDILKSETRDGAQFITANKINIAGTVKGDVFAIGQDVTISGAIDGNLFIASSNITLSEGTSITGSIFLIGQKINLSGTIDGSNYLAASSITTTDTFKTNREFNFVTKDVNLNGTFSRKINGATENTILGGKFNNDILLKTNYLTYRPTLDVKGKLTYYAPYQALSQNDNGQTPLIGEEDYNNTPLPTFWQKFATELGATILGLVYLLIIGFVWLWLWRDRYNKIVSNLKDNLWPALGWGIMVLLLLPITFLVLAFSVVGLPLALILLGFVIFWSYLSSIIVAGMLGDFIMTSLNKDGNKYPYLSLLLGLITLIVLFSIPIVGWIFKLFSVIIAFGVMAIARKEILGIKF